MRLRKWTRFYSRMPIKFKLTIGSAVLIMLLFIGYNTLQYIYTEKWIINREKSSVQKSMNGILNYFLERETGFKPDDFPTIRQYLDKVNRDDQRIRIIDASNVPILTVTNNVPESWIEPQSSAFQKTIINRSNGHSILIMKSPLTIFEFNGTIEIVKSMDEFEELTAMISRIMLLFTVGAVVFSLLVGWLLARKLLKPLQAMAQTIRDIDSKGLQERMQPNANGDEISTLMILFNQMMDQVEGSFHQQSRFVEDASHELRTPIAIIEGYLDMLHRWGKKDPTILNESLNASLEEFARLKGLISELLSLSRAEKAPLIIEESYMTNPTEEIQRTVNHFMLIHPDFRVESDLESLNGANILISIEHLEQIIHIILDNAAKYSTQNKAIFIRAKVFEEKAVIAITDNGVGISTQDLPFVTDRFYRVDKARTRDQGGNGIGLAIAKKLIERYLGTLVLNSQLTLGTTVTITLPCSPKELDEACEHE